jgi:hypothetical protein
MKHTPLSSRLFDRFKPIIVLAAAVVLSVIITAIMALMFVAVSL